MKIATWNVNSLRARLPHVLDWLERQRPDVLALQETKVADAECPQVEFEALGYRALVAGQKGYNGVAVLSRAAADGDVVTAIPGFPDSARRVLAATVAGVRVVNLYVPNGQAVGSEKYSYKLAWLDALIAWLRDEMERHARVAVVGDLNIAPENRDVHDPQLWDGRVLFSVPERAAFERLIGLGLQDAFRLFQQPEASFSWWDYRMGAFRRNQGLRIDHILVSRPLAAACTACTIDREPRRLERPSDHTPVVAEFAL
jgi:exodeoxyribonuclease-3